MATAIKHIGVVSMPVTDQERAKQFYVDQVGLECVADATFGPGTRWLQVGPPGASTTIALVTWFENFKPGSVSGFVFEVDDVSATYRELLGRGVPFDGEPFDGPGGRFAIFNDPDGNNLTLHQIGSE